MLARKRAMAEGIEEEEEEKANRCRSVFLLDVRSINPSKKTVCAGLNLQTIQVPD